MSYPNVISENKVKDWRDHPGKKQEHPTTESVHDLTGGADNQLYQTIIELYEQMAGLPLNDERRGKLDAQAQELSIELALRLECSGKVLCAQQLSALLCLRRKEILSLH